MDLLEGTSRNIHCPGDTIVYNCSLENINGTFDLTWIVSIPGLKPINFIYYYGNPLLSVASNYTSDNNDISINATLRKSRVGYIESTIAFKVPSFTSLNGTLLECEVEDTYHNSLLESAKEVLYINASGIIMLPVHDILVIINYYCVLMLE